MTYQKIILPSRPQPDTILGIFLLKKFGKEKYPGIENALIEIWTDLPKNETPNSLEKKGYLLIDIGGGKFDHHFEREKTTASQLITEDLRIINDSALSKLLTYVERDDKYGLGTISSDPIDKAFGLSGLITNLNKILPENPQKVVEIILPLIYAHYLEEKRRTQELPKEFEERLKENKAEIFEVRQGDKKLKIISIESANPSLAGWLRAAEGLKGDVIIQKMPSGHINILTKPLKRVDLRWAIALLRNEEAILKNQKLKLLTFELMRPGKIIEVPEWYYDRATNSIFNGGVNPQGVSPTIIPLERIKELIKEGLSSQTPAKRSFAPQVELQSHQFFLEIRLPIEIAKEIREMISEMPPGIKLHRPENYHLTLLYLEDYKNEEIPELIVEIKSSLQKIKPFSIIISSQNFKTGKVPGYPAKNFYFEIKDKQGEKVLKEIRKNLEKNVSNYQKEFFPHLTIASPMPGIEEEVVKEAEIKLKKKKTVKFSVEKIRLTEILRKINNQLVYRTKSYFPLE